MTSMHAEIPTRVCGRRHTSQKSLVQYCAYCCSLGVGHSCRSGDAARVCERKWEKRWEKVGKRKVYKISN